MLNGKAPYVKVITDGDDDVNNKAPVNTNGGSKHHEHEGDLVNIVTKSAGPADTEISLEDRA